MRDANERKIELALRALREHHADVEPDPGFVARVKDRLRSAAGPDPLHWAAVRLLPAGLALALVLGVLVWRELPAGGAAPASVNELAAWMVDPSTGSTP